MIDYKNFVRDRDEALLSLDKEKILDYMKKYGASYKFSSDFVFWVSVHKAILQLNSATNEQKDKSFSWLLENGCNPIVKPVMNNTFIKRP
jgi:hypothetical protein